MPIEKKQFELHLNVMQNDISAISLLAEHCHFSRQKIKQIMQNGSVWLTHNNTTKRIRRVKKKLRQGQILHCYYDEGIFNQIPIEAELIADKDDYSLWFKPAGMLSQGSKYGDHCTLYRWVESHLKPQRNAFIVHRLDKATSGLMLIAHSKNAAAALSRLFAEGAIKKYYKAIIHGHFPDEKVLPFILDEPLDKKQAQTKILHSQVLDQSHRPINLPADVLQTFSPANKAAGKFMFDNSIMNQQIDSASLVDIRLLSGRKHQIRQHLSHIGHPVVGDRLYGTGKADGYDLCLTAYKISFLSPFDKQNQYYELDSSYYPTLRVVNQKNVAE
ncbi:MAG: RNA pseudouridine synthase [gamma proteobacterium symbiont of Taylorina sp.]|nr:RNA pseudouridine synthase [gamma proteobacterium symbiont of Taylorina sp.]